MEDWLLIIQCKRGNTKALGRIYRKYKKDCLLLAMALLNDSHAADDIWHDVFVGFAQSIANFQFKGQLRGYLMTCVANRARNYLKSQKRVLKPEALHIAREDAAAPLDRLILNEQTRHLAKALAQLPEKQREVILLHMHGKMTFAMIARELGVFRNTAKSRYRYGLDKLQTIFSEEAEL